MITSALLHVQHHGRLEYIRSNLLIDGAHNEDGMKKLSEYLKGHVHKDIVYCFNLKSGKSASLVLDIFPNIAQWTLVRAKNPLVSDADMLTQQIQR